MLLKMHPVYEMRLHPNLYHDVTQKEILQSENELNQIKASHHHMRYSTNRECKLNKCIKSTIDDLREKK